MNIEEIRDYCIAKPEVEEGFPFGEDTLVFKAKGKMFLLMSLSADPLQFNAKCDPDKAALLREEYSCVIPGYHMNKKHWNTVIVDGQLSKQQLLELIDHSYELIVSSIKKPRAKKAS